MNRARSIVRLRAYALTRSEQIFRLEFVSKHSDSTMTESRNARYRGRASKGQARLVQPLDRDRLPAPLAAVHGAEAPAPQDAARRKIARGGHQLGVGRGADPPRERLGNGTHIRNAPALLRSLQLPRKLSRPLLGCVRLPLQGSLAIPRVSLELGDPLLGLPHRCIALQHPCFRRLRPPLQSSLLLGKLTRLSLES